MQLHAVVMKGHGALAGSGGAVPSLDPSMADLQNDWTTIMLIVRLDCRAEQGTSVNDTALKIVHAFSNILV